jgi:hypothetical protein
LRADVPGADVLGAAGNSATPEGCEELIAACPKVDVLVLNLGIYEAVDIYEAGDDRWQELVENQRDERRALGAALFAGNAGAKRRAGDFHGQ